MAIDEKTRLDIRQWFEQEMGDPELASAVMEAMPPLDYQQVATKADVANVGVELRGEMAELRGDLRSEMAELRVELRSEMAELRVELRSEMAELRVELRSEMAAGYRRTVTWLVATQLTTIVALVTILG